MIRMVYRWFQIFCSDHISTGETERPIKVTTLDPDPVAKLMELKFQLFRLNNYQYTRFKTMQLSKVIVFTTSYYSYLQVPNVVFRKIKQMNKTTRSMSNDSHKNLSSLAKTPIQV